MAKTADLEDSEALILTPEDLYERALARMNDAELILQPAYKEANFLHAAQAFEDLGDLRDARELSERCRELAQQAAREGVEKRYGDAVARMESTDPGIHVDLEKLADTFASLGDHRDSKEKLAACRQEMGRSRRKQGHRRLCFLAVFLAIAALVGWLAAAGGFRYLMGFAYLQAERYDNARSNYELAGSFANAADMAKRCEALALREAGEGTNVTYGKWRWVVLDNDKAAGTVLLLATSVGEGHPCYAVAFNEEGGETTWAASSLRAWLNGPFLEDSFDERERTFLLERECAASENPVYGTAYEAEGTDLLAPLSAQEAQRYEAVVSTLGNDCWLRTPGERMSAVAYITAHHTIMYYGLPADTDQICVRPAILVDVKGLLEGVEK